MLQPNIDAKFDVNDFIKSCQEVLGLGTNEISKITGISRANIESHRKGTIDNHIKSYAKLNNFITLIKEKYKTSLKPGVRNIVIKKKTLIQHMLKNKNDLDSLMPLFNELYEIVNAEHIKKNKIDNERKNKRNLTLSIESLV